MVFIPPAFLDYTPPSIPPLMFNALNARDPQCASINITPDGILENTESFSVILQSSSLGVVLNMSSAIVNIIDDDGKCAAQVYIPTPTIMIY